MPLYEYACSACGSLVERFCGMGRAPRVVRCVCGGWARRRITAPALRTETTLSDSVRRSYAVAGHKVESWKDVQALEKSGECAIVNQHDLDLAERRQGKAADELIADAASRLRQANRIEVQSG